MSDPDPKQGSRSGKVRAEIVVVVAAASVVAAVTVLVTYDRPVNQSPSDGAAVGTTTSEPTETPSSSAPIRTPQWQIDARTVYGRDFAAFRAPTAGLEFDSDAYGVIDAGDILVTAIGLPNPRGYSLDAVRLMRIDAETGDVLWSAAPETGLNNCASWPVRDEIVCFDSYSGSPAFVAIGVRDGNVRRVPIPADWFPFAIETDGSALYVLEGNPEDSESVLHGGTLDDMGSAWSRPVTAFAPWEGVEGTLIHVDEDRGAVTLGGEATFFDPANGSELDGLELRSDTSVVDTETGDEVWNLDEFFAGALTVGDTVYTLANAQIVATSSGKEVWRWPLPDGVDGFPAAGSIVSVESGVYFLGSDTIARLAAVSR